MYILDCFQRLTKKQNIGIFIYLILNTFLVMAIFGDPILGLSMYVISLVLALSPFGEWILRLQQGCKPLARKEHIERLTPLFDEVYRKAREIDPSIPDGVKLFISNDAAPNAFATGRKTICLTKGLLQYDDDEIKAVLAHEFGHLSAKDTDFILIVTVGNMIVTALFVLFRLFFSFVGIVVSIANNSLGTLIMTFLMDVVLVAMMWLWTKFGTLLVMHSVRKNEYEADAFAHKCGYNQPLVRVLDSFNALDGPATKGLWANLASSHPDPDQRIGKLQDLNEVA
ncbi:zinc metalloprotease HtpX [Halalkalibacter alkaliphilus]|uniref:Zinc metalloprotease HtpX n=1 Tax=Halalkalibacter alkaliphilus TaxID=2917993 RepID=A0A9X2IA81_9BACI|nr:zinc metalloprotease HtpX [Halalkalibacter alkaliphilus]MCL7749200.1 zinc metalloprotease HtpX [Halalkalibacter alkaliphilus]